MGFWDRISGRKGGRQEPERKQLEGYALVGTNVLSLDPWKGRKIEPPEEKRLGNLLVWSLATPIIDGRQPMTVDRVGRYVYCGHSIYRFDLEGNPKGRLCLEKGPYGGLAVSHDGQVLVSRGSWLYRIDMDGRVIKAVQSTWFGSIAVLPDNTVVGVKNYRSGGIDKTVLGLVKGKGTREVDLSKIMVYGRDVRCSPDGFAYVVGGPVSTTFVGNTVFKLDTAGHLINSCSIFKNVGAVCPTNDGEIDVLEIDGSRLVRLSHKMEVVYDSQRDSRSEATLLIKMKRRGVTLLNYVQAMDTDEAGNCYVLAHDALVRFRQFWAEPSV